MGRVASWFGASSSGGGGGGPYPGRSRGAGSAGTNGAPDFLAQLEDPDKRRLSEAQARSRGEKILSPAGCEPWSHSGENHAQELWGQSWLLNICSEQLERGWSWFPKSKFTYRRDHTIHA